MQQACHQFLLLFLTLNESLAQKPVKDISSDFQQSINKFIEKIAGLQKNMKKLAAKRKKLKSEKNKLGLSCAKLSTADLATNWLGAI